MTYVKLFKGSELLMSLRLKNVQNTVMFLVSVRMFLSGKNTRNIFKKAMNNKLDHILECLVFRFTIQAINKRFD